jgi:hypothetical protein
MGKAEDTIKKYSDQELAKRFNELPKKLTGAIVSQQTLDALQSIAKENAVAKDYPKLLRYTTAILFGIVPITLLRETIQEELQIDEERARKIAMEIRDKIFMQVQDELRKIHNLG